MSAGRGAKSWRMPMFIARDVRVFTIALNRKDVGVAVCDVAKSAFGFG